VEIAGRSWVVSFRDNLISVIALTRVKRAWMRVCRGGNGVAGYSVLSANGELTLTAVRQTFIQ
jgi:hypothetical protein